MAAGRLDVLMGLNSAEFTRGLTKAEYETQKFQKNLERSFASLGTAIKSVLGGIAVKQIVDGFIGITNSLDDLGNAAQSLGTTAVALAEFRRAAGESGVAAEKFDSSLTKLSSKMEDAAAGGKKSAAVFKALGIQVTNSSGQLKTTDEILGQVADAFSKYRDGTEKTALAVQLFGKAGAAMIPYLNQGADGLRKFAGVTEESVKRAKELQQQLDEMKASLNALGIALATSLMPFLTKTIQEFIAAQAAAGGFLDTLKLLGKQSAQTLEDPGKKIHELTAELKALEATSDDWKGFFKLADDEARVKSLKQELQFLKEIQRNRALANAPGKDYRQEGFGTLPGAPRRAGGGDGKPKKEDIDFNAQALANYVDQLTKAIPKQEYFSKVQETTAAIESERFGKLNPAMREWLLLMSQQVDEADEYGKKIVHNAKADKDYLDMLQRENEILNRITGRADDDDKAEKLRILNAGLGDGRITWEQYNKGLDEVFGKITGLTNEIEKTSDASEQLGLIFASSIGDFIKNPTDGKTFLQALMEDLLQLTTQLLIIEPLAKSLKGAFGGMTSGGGGGGNVWDDIMKEAGDLISYDVGSRFVPADGPAMLHRGERVLTVAENRRYTSGGNSSVVINQSFAPGTTRETVNQAAAEAARKLSNASRRNN